MGPPAPFHSSGVHLAAAMIARASESDLLEWLQNSVLPMNIFGG
jgi:hypothetical protein